MLRRYGLWMVFALVACVVGAWFTGAHRPAEYSSAADVDVEAAPLPNTVPAAVNMTTEKEVASSGVVLAGAAPLAGMPAPVLAGHLTVSVPAGANVLSIGCTMPAPVAAERCATAVTKAYMNLRNETASPPKVQARDPLSVTLVTAAQRPSAPSGLSLKLLLSVGAFIGLLLGAGTAFVRDRLDDRVRDRDDLERCLEGAVLGAVPRVRRSARPASVFTTAPNSAAAEAYRYLRAHLDRLLARTEGAGKVVLVTGAQPREGRTCVASNLALALAQAGIRVLLVDADLRHPSLASVFETGARPGLTELLAGRAALGDVVLPAGVAGLQLVTAGEEDRPAELFDGARLARVLQRLRTAADVVIVDSGPVLSVADPIALALLADLVLMVASVRRSRRAAIRVAAQELRTAGPVTIAGVLTGLPRSLTRSQPRPGHLTAAGELPKTALPAAPRARAAAPAPPPVTEPGPARPGGLRVPGRRDQDATATIVIELDQGDGHRRPAPADDNHF
jgi:capsular exopolysaccharide synthesis family protein